MELLNFDKDKNHSDILIDWSLSIPYPVKSLIGILISYFMFITAFSLGFNFSFKNTLIKSICPSIRSYLFWNAPWFNWIIFVDPLWFLVDLWKLTVKSSESLFPRGDEDVE